MIIEDKVLIGFYLISSICMIVCGIINIKNERHKSDPDYSEGIMIIIGGITPGAMFIGIFVVVALIIYVIVEVPNVILKKILNKTK